MVFVSWLSFLCSWFWELGYECWTGLVILFAWVVDKRLYHGDFPRLKLWETFPCCYWAYCSGLYWSHVQFMLNHVELHPVTDAHISKSSTASQPNEAFDDNLMTIWWFVAGWGSTPGLFASPAMSQSSPSFSPDLMSLVWSQAPNNQPQVVTDWWLLMVVSDRFPLYIFECL